MNDFDEIGYEIKKYLINYLSTHSWEEYKVPERARCLFTTWYLVNDIHYRMIVDTMLNDIFQISHTNLKYGEFREYMLEYTGFK